MIGGCVSKPGGLENSVYSLVVDIHRFFLEISQELFKLCCLDKHDAPGASCDRKAQRVSSPLMDQF